MSAFQCWADWKSDTKAKASNIKKSSGATGGGEKLPIELTELELRLLNIMGHISVEGNIAVDEAGFTPQNLQKKVRFCEITVPINKQNS